MTDGAQGDFRPVPDPTRLTTEQLYREIAGLKIEIGKDITGLKELVVQRFVANDTATRAALDAADKSVSKSESSILKLVDTQSQQISSMSKQFDTQIADVKGRLIRLEEGRSTSQTSYSNIVAMIGLVGGILIGGAGLIVGLTRSSSDDKPPLVIERVVERPASPSAVSPAPVQ